MDTDLLLNKKLVKIFIISFILSLIFAFTLKTASAEDKKPVTTPVITKPGPTSTPSAIKGPDGQPVKPVTKIELKKDVMREKLEIRRASISARITRLKENRAGKGTGLKNRLDQKKMASVDNHVQKLIDRDKNVLNHLNDILTRLENRVKQLKEKGRDVSKIEELIAAAKLKKQTVEDSIASTENALKLINTTSDPKEAFNIGKEAQVNVKDAFKDFHQSLVNIVTEIKKGNQ